MRPNKTLSILIILVVFALLFTTSTHANRVINFQGRLTDQQGNTLDGTYDIIFSIYASDPNSGPLWTESHTNINVSNGTVNVLLGTITSLDEPQKVTFDQERYLGITIDCDHDPNTKEDEMTPRQRILPTLYSYNADRLDGKDSSEFTTPQTDAGRPGVTEHLYEGSTRLVDRYLGKGAQAQDADKLDGYHAATSGSADNAIPVINSGTTYSNLRAGYAIAAGNASSASSCNSCSSANSCSNCTNASKVNDLQFGPLRICSWVGFRGTNPDPSEYTAWVWPSNWSIASCKNLVCNGYWNRWALFEYYSDGTMKRLDGGNCP